MRNIKQTICNKKIFIVSDSFKNMLIFGVFDKKFSIYNEVFDKLWNFKQWLCNNRRLQIDLKCNTIYV